MTDIAVMSYARDQFSGAARCAEKPNRQRDNEILEYQNCRALARRSKLAYFADITIPPAFLRRVSGKTDPTICHPSTV
jgi:hypothetical protein